MTAGASRILAILAAALVAACQQASPPTAKELAVDLRAYMTELKKWEPLEKEVFSALAEVERTYYVDDDFVIRRFKGALPKIDHHVQRLAGYEPETVDLKGVHERYREGWAAMGDGFRAVIGSMEAKDYTRLASSKNQVEAARRKLIEAFAELDTMLAETEPELERLRGGERKAAVGTRHEAVDSAA